MSVKANSPNGFKASTSGDEEGEAIMQLLMKTVGLRLPLVYCSTIEKTAKLLRQSPRTALLWVGGVGLLTAAFLMLLLAAFLQ